MRAPPVARPNSTTPENARPATERTSTAPPTHSSGAASAPLAVQTQSKVNSATGPDEQEADRMSTEVMQHIRKGSAPWLSSRLKAAPPAQGPGGGPTVQAKSTGWHGLGAQGGAISAGMASGIAQARGGGQPIPDDTRVKMERAFGSDFSDVRAHADAKSDMLNRSLSARAFTTGKDIFFGQGAYAPHSDSGMELLAHELAHVEQQGAMSGPQPIQREWRGNDTDIQNWDPLISAEKGISWQRDLQEQAGKFHIANPLTQKTGIGVLDSFLDQYQGQWKTAAEWMALNEWQAVRAHIQSPFDAVVNQPPPNQQEQQQEQQEELQEEDQQQQAPKNKADPYLRSPLNQQGHLRNEWDQEKFFAMLRNLNMAGICNVLSVAWLNGDIPSGKGHLGIDQENFTHLKVFKQLADKIASQMANSDNDAIDLSMFLITFLAKKDLHLGWFATLSNSERDLVVRKILEHMSEQSSPEESMYEVEDSDAQQQRAKEKRKLQNEINQSKNLKEKLSDSANLEDAEVESGLSGQHQSVLGHEKYQDISKVSLTNAISTKIDRFFFNHSEASEGPWKGFFSLNATLNADENVIPNNKAKKKGADDAQRNRSGHQLAFTYDPIKKQLRLYDQNGMPQEYKTADPAKELGSWIFNNYVRRPMNTPNGPSDHFDVDIVCLA